MKLHIFTRCSQEELTDKLEHAYGKIQIHLDTIEKLNEKIDLLEENNKKLSRAYTKSMADLLEYQKNALTTDAPKPKYKTRPLKNSQDEATQTTN